MDETRPLGRLSADGGEGIDGDFEPVRLRLLAALAAEAVGVAQKALELGVEYVSQREQFGKKIGTYQAVSHPLADTYVETELARSLAYWAAWCVAEDDEQAAVAVAAAKAQCAETAVAACERSIQVHGGIGFTWEHPCTATTSARSGSTPSAATPRPIAPPSPPRCWIPSPSAEEAACRSRKQKCSS